MRLASAYFRRRIGRPICLVWDRLAAHRSLAVQKYLAAHSADFTKYCLPGYAPELNPEEQCNRWAKRRLENAVPLSDDELRASARRAFRQLQHQPAVHAAFLRHAGLRLT